MTWLIIIVTVIAYIAIGQFVAGTLNSSEMGEIICITIIWPIVMIVFIFTYPFAKLRKLGERFGNWLDRKE